jgi:uncharacterized protein involved in exopolysaccharide biosynthesis
MEPLINRGADQPSGPLPGGEVTLLDYWRAVHQRKRLIGVLCAASVLVSLVFSLLSPKMYRARATILMPKEGSGGNQVAVSLGAGGGASAALGSLGALSGIAMQFAPTLNRDIFLGYLNSSSLRDEIMGQLKKSWGPSVESQIEEVIITADKDRANIAVELSARDPKLAAAAANLYFETLNQRMIRQGATQMSAQRAFVVERIGAVSKELGVAEEALKQFQIQNKYIVSIDTQTRGAVDAGAGLRAQLIAAELELERLRAFATDSHPQVVQWRQYIGELKRQMSRSQYGQPLTLPSENRNSGKTREEFFVPTVRQPELYLQNLRLYRDLKVQEAVYTLLTQQLESIKLSEASDLPQVQFLDRADPPSGPYRPRIIWNMTAAAIGSLMIGVFLSLFLDYIERVKSLEKLGRVG